MTTKANKKKGKRYTEAEKKELLKKYYTLRQEGVTTSEASKEVGVPYITLRSWDKKDLPGLKRLKKNSTKPKYDAKKVKQDKKAKYGVSITISTEDGIHISGLKLSQVPKIVAKIRADRK